MRLKPSEFVIIQSKERTRLVSNLTQPNLIFWPMSIYTSDIPLAMKTCNTKYADDKADCKRQFPAPAPPRRKFGK